MTVAGISFVGYVIAGLIPNAFVVLPITMALMLGTLLLVRSGTHNVRRKAKTTQQTD